MIQVYYAYTDILQKKNLNIYIEMLSPKTKSKLAGLKRSEDKDLLLLSSLLLSKLLQENGHADYNQIDLQYSDSGRPFFADSPFDFNISHTANCAAVAYSENRRIGLDIEKIMEIDFSDFEYLFSKKEWDKINSSTNKNRTFFHYWTLLESALKADGRGLPLISSDKILIRDDMVYIDGKQWFSEHKLFDPSISCCITSDRKIEAISMNRILSI